MNSKTEFTTIINSRIGENKGHLRIWLEGGKLARCGYNPDDKYSIDVVSDKVVITRSESGTFAVSRRNKSGRVFPLIEITSARCNDISRIFTHEQMIRVVVDEKKIVITKHHVDSQTQEREARLLSKLATGKPLDTCSLFYGFGMLDRAAHDGLDSAGIRSRLSVIVEREAKYLDPAIETHADMFSGSTYIIESPIQFARITERNPVDLLIAGIPCTGASKAGKAKNQNKTAEDHPDAGAMFYYTLRCIELMNPAIISLENVCEYSNTESMAVIRSVLSTMGYELIETTLSGKDYGSIEDRKRMCVFAVSVNLNVNLFPFIETLENLVSVPDQNRKIEDVLDYVPLDSDAWKTYEYLAEKEIKDKAAGKGFRRQLLTGQEKQCGTIGRHYNKGRSTEPFIQHPTDPNKSRLLTVAEHAKVKGYPLDKLNDQMSVTTAHEALGQGVIYPAFKAAFAVLGDFLSTLINREAVAA
jgi:DNA (cytosine-5)-methyltransferase 1